jgi:hypothetical protein
MPRITRGSSEARSPNRLCFLARLDPDAFAAIAAFAEALIWPHDRALQALMLLGLRAEHREGARCGITTALPCPRPRRPVSPTPWWSPAGGATCTCHYASEASPDAPTHLGGGCCDRLTTKSYAG